MNKNKIKQIKLSITLLITILFIIIYPKLPFQINIETKENKTLENKTIDNKQSKVHIDSVWIETNINSVDFYTNCKSLGFIIYTNLSIDYCKHKKCKVLLFLYSEDFQVPIKAKDEHYQTKSGSLYARRILESQYDFSNWTDVGLFIPYQQLDTYKNNVISYLLIVRDNNDNELARKEVMNVKYK